MESYILIDNTAEKQYEFHIGEWIPYIEYIKPNTGTIYLTHTEVPLALEGRGVGSRLTEAALQDIERQGLQLVPQCPFVAAYIRKHPVWKKLLMPGIRIV